MKVNLEWIDFYLNLSKNNIDKFLFGVLEVLNLFNLLYLLPVYVASYSIFILADLDFFKDISNKYGRSAKIIQK